MKEILHFKSQRERLDYLKGGFEEIKPLEAAPQVVRKAAEEAFTEASEAVSKPKKGNKEEPQEKGLQIVDKGGVQEVPRTPNRHI